ncbi:MAG: DNA replication/repair protein RecF, partial [Bacteroidota bacterium]|nr:DNA replication/repair protein RecF [Bacteroidota bacterium]
MYIRDLSLLNFKNFEETELAFSPKLNCFIGNNGVGKTNLLDAVYYLSFCKSFLNSIEAENIRHGEEFLAIQGVYVRNDQEEVIHCGLKKGQSKQFKRNKKEYSKLADHIGLLPLVMVSPSDISLILGGSEERRKFMDSVISQYDRKYLDVLLRYNRALLQRNNLLKNFAQIQRFDYGMLEAWDDQLIVLGKEINVKRAEFIQKLLPVFQKFYELVSQGHETVELVYESALNDNDFQELIREALPRDRAAQHTTVGIHKDDLHFKLGDYPMKKLGSQGQKKTYLVALKLAQFDFICKISGLKPILLLDDIFDKLDSIRV